MRSVARLRRIASAAARRSPLTSVRSEASIATSVPVPIASPRSACASAGASLTPSPTIATTRPSACSRRTTSALSAGQHLGDHLVDADLGGDGARGRLVVAGQQHRAQAERLAARATASARRRLDGVGDDEDRARACPSQPAAIAVCPRRLGRGARRVELGRQLHAPLGEQRRAPDDERVPVDDALDAEALAVARTPRRRAARRARARARCAIAWAIGCSEACSSAPTSRSASLASTPSATIDARRGSSARSSPCRSCRARSCRRVRVDSSTSGPLISRPSCAPRPVPTISAVGVASPSAHGQAMISTATAAVNANVALSPAPSQKPSVRDGEAR